MTIGDVYQSFNTSGLFNTKIFQDVWIGYLDAGWSNVFTAAGSKYYLRYLTLNFGLGGLFTFKTPRQFIEGFYDANLEALYNTPIYMGGDKTINPFLSLNMRTTNPQNNPISFFTGVDDFELTRQMGSWLDHSNVRVAGKAYNTTTTVVDDYFNPWVTDIAITGTDGIQFSPLLESSTVI